QWSCPVSLHLSASGGVLHPFPTRRPSDLTPRSSPSPAARRYRATPPRSAHLCCAQGPRAAPGVVTKACVDCADSPGQDPRIAPRSEEHTSELQSRENLVCRHLLEKRNTQH